MNYRIMSGMKCWAESSNWKKDVCAPKMLYALWKKETGCWVTVPPFGIFVVVLPGIEPGQAMEQAQKIQARIRNQVFLQDQGYEVFIRSSFGIATFPYHADDMTELLTKADHALFSAKGAGKDRIKSTNSSDQKPNLNSESATH